MLSSVPAGWWWGIAAAVIAALIAWLGHTFLTAGTVLWNTQRAKVEIGTEVRAGLTPLGNRIYVRHVRDGPDVVDEKGRLKNRDHLFRVDRKTGALVARWRCDKRLGSQFKCYVDLCEPSKAEDGIISALEQAGVENVSRDGQASLFPDRYWFLLPGYPNTVTVDGFRNNLYPPRAH